MSPGLALIVIGLVIALLVAPTIGLVLVICGAVLLLAGR